MSLERLGDIWEEAHQSHSVLNDKAAGGLEDCPECVALAEWLIKRLGPDCIMREMLS